MAISDELPSSRDEWPPEVLDAVQKFVCGDVVEEPPYFYVADPKFAVLKRTRDYFDDRYSGPEIIDASEFACPFGVITTQTCDLGEVDFDPPNQPFIGISPVFDGSLIDPDIQSLLKQGKRIGGPLHLPALSDQRPGFWVADFRLELPVEKSWLVGRTPIKGFADETGARRVPDAINDIRSRPAWATVINECVDKGLVDALKQLRAESRPLFKKVCESVEEIGARADSMLNPKVVQLAAFTTTSTSELDLVDWWNATALAIASALESRGLVVQPAEWLALDQCDVLTHRGYSPVNLGRFSKR